MLQGPFRRRMFGDIEMYDTSGSYLEGNEYIKDAEAGRHRHKEVASYNTVRMISEEGRPPLVPRSGWARLLLNVLADCARESRACSFSKSSPAIRSSPRVGFSATIRRINRSFDRRSNTRSTSKGLTATLIDFVGSAN